MCEVFGSTGYIATTYTYSPYGSVTATGNVIQPIQWSSEVWDSELGMVYYNWRYYSPKSGRWESRDFLESSSSYEYIENTPHYAIDIIGNYSKEIIGSKPKDPTTALNHNNQDSKPVSVLAAVGNLDSSELPTESMKVKYDYFMHIQSTKEMITNLSKLIKSNECIYRIMFNGHGLSLDEGHDIRIQGDKGFFSSRGNATNFGINLKKFLCKKSKAFFLVCDLGQNTKYIQKFADASSLKCMCYGGKMVREEKNFHENIWDSDLTYIPKGETTAFLTRHKDAFYEPIPINLHSKSRTNTTTAKEKAWRLIRPHKKEKEYFYKYGHYISFPDGRYMTESGIWDF